jgi:predicted translin family RNA/ssDNA-binding protein
MYDPDDIYNPNRMNPAIKGIDRQMEQLQREREEILSRDMPKPLEPKDQMLVTLAHEAGENKALYRGQFDRNEKQLETIKELRSKVDELEDIKQSRDIWRDRAETAEATLKRSRAARRK